MLTMLIKPSSGYCDLRCRYCFYHSLVGEWSGQELSLMSDETAEALIRRAYQYARRHVSFAFQGGEPTLRGLDFFRKFVEMAERQKPERVTISFALQTNGMHIDDEWATFLKDKEFLTGLSLDGPAEIHDLNRLDATGGATHRSVMRAAALLRRHGAEFNILSVITDQSARHAVKIYQWYKKQGFRFLQFIPCLAPLGTKLEDARRVLTPEHYGSFLMTLFDLWYRDWKNGDYISIRFFDNTVYRMIGLPSEQCGLEGRCRCQFVVEADGSVYPCDFYVKDSHRLGNLHDLSLQELENNAAFFVDGSQNPDPACKTCAYFQLCQGGCRRDREPEGGNRFCRPLSQFYAYSEERLRIVANAELKARNTG